MKILDFFQQKVTVAFTNEQKSVPDFDNEIEHEKNKRFYKSYAIEDNELHSATKNLRNYYLDEESNVGKKPVLSAIYSDFNTNSSIMNLNSKSKKVSDVYINSTTPTFLDNQVSQAPKVDSEHKFNTEIAYNNNLSRYSRSNLYNNKSNSISEFYRNSISPINTKSNLINYQVPKFAYEEKVNTEIVKSSLIENQKNIINYYIRPVPRLCSILKSYQQVDGPNYMGFGISPRLREINSSNFMRVSIVNYKSPAYLSGLEAGDLIVEINRRKTHDMNDEEALYHIKKLYELNNEVKLLVVSEFCFNWLKEKCLLNTLNSDDLTVFNYDEYLKTNRKNVPRLCKVKLFPLSNSFGITVETVVNRQLNTLDNIQFQKYSHKVTRLEKDSPAYSLNIKVGDRIIECDGFNVEEENEKQIAQRLYEALIGPKQISLLVVDADTDNYFKSKCLKIHSMLPIIKSISSNF